MLRSFENNYGKIEHSGNTIDSAYFESKVRIGADLIRLYKVTPRFKFSPRNGQNQLCSNCAHLSRNYVHDQLPSSQDTRANNRSFHRSLFFNYLCHVKRLSKLENNYNTIDFNRFSTIVFHQTGKCQLGSR